MVKKVELTKNAQKKVHKLPNQVQRKLRLWIKQVEMLGIANVRKIKGYHDEPLFGTRKNQRSVRLNGGYRAFYVETSKNTIEIAEVFDINKHKY
ncbi:MULTISPECIES: hypothetical protein [Cysteiniphilum]|uniref:hypothetical protein n=1 Tax=Cysteiniphilum TaxID=2056696 RepID=UPI001786EF1F|nr:MULTISPECIES: hypothetical protein [Cysteiniphilum]